MKLSGEVKSLLEYRHKEVLESLRFLWSDKQRDYEALSKRDEFEILRQFRVRELILIMDHLGRLEELETK